MSKGFRAALFITALGGGGAERITVALANGLAEHGVEVDLVVTRSENAFTADVSSRVQIIDLGAPRIVLGFLPFVRYLQRNRPDIVLAALSPTNVLALLARALTRSKVPVIVCEHSTLSHQAGQRASLRQRFLPYVMRHVYRWADGIVAVSQGVATDLAATLGLKRDAVTVIYNPVPTSTVSEKAQEPLEHPWFSQGAPAVILAVGRLVKAKDFETLLRAFALLSQEMEARLMILGDGQERARLEALAQELGIATKVAMPGFVANPFKYMANAGAFVLSSRWEGLPTVLIEALACGVPVVSTNCKSGPAEILNEGRYGQLVPVGDASALATALRQTLLESSDAEPRRGRAQDFHASAAVERYLDLMKSHL